MDIGEIERIVRVVPEPAPMTKEAPVEPSFVPELAPVGPSEAKPWETA